MKKNDFKKLALLGLAAGSFAVAGTASADQAINLSSETMMLAAGCGSHGCNQTPKPPTTTNGQIAEEDQVPPVEGSCKNKSSCTGKTGCNGKTAPANGQYRA